MISQPETGEVVYTTSPEQEKLLEELNNLKTNLLQNYPQIPQQIIADLFNECTNLVLNGNRSDAYTRHSLYAEFHNLERRILSIQSREKQAKENPINLELLEYAKIGIASISNSSGFLTMGAVLILYLTALDQLYTSSTSRELSTFTPLMCLILLMTIFEALLAKDLAIDFKNRVEKKKSEISKNHEAES